MEILTIGHGSQEFESFHALLRQHGVEIVVDTRSKPFSSRYPQYSQRTLAVLLDEAGIKYAFLGDKLGGRPADPALSDANGRPDYSKIEATSAYQQGLRILIALARSDDTVAIMCSESDYSECHRYKLIARSLALRDIEVKHILKDGTLVENPAPQLTLID